ncbi:MAG: DUF530 domain-containing protein [Methanobacteriaceae archaeon]
MDETILISKAENYLKEIQDKNLFLNDISDLNNFVMVYLSLANNLANLQEMKDDMESKGYSVPYRSLSKYGVGSGEVVLEEVGEVNRHTQHFRTKASAKKNILDRVKSAISAHKLAIGQLNEYAIIKCINCSKKYTPNEFLENNFKCCTNNNNNNNNKGKTEIYNEELVNNTNIKSSTKLKSINNFKIEINPQRACRIDILQYIPLSGNYRVLMSYLSNTGRNAFKKVLNILKQEKKGSVKTVSVIIKFKQKGRWIRKKVNLETEYIDSYEEEIRKEYGKDVRIELIQFNRSKPSIINDKQTRTVLALGYAHFAEDINIRIKDKILSEKLNDLEQLKLYDELLMKKNLTSSETKYGEEDLEDWREIQFIDSLKELGLMDKRENLNKNLNEDLKRRKKIEKDIFENIAPSLMIWDLFKYYLTSSYDKRSKHSGPYPHIRIEIDIKQTKIFKMPRKDIINILNKVENENMIYFSNMDQIIKEKLAFEKKIKGLNLKINYPALGAAISNLNSKNTVEYCSKAFFANVSDVEAEIKNIENLDENKNKNKKSNLFLNLVKNK